MTEPLNHHAALIYVMVTMSAVDRTMTDAELARIGEIVSNLPKKLRETAYAVALEVAAADLDVKQEETRFLEMLRDTLELDPLTTTGIERGIRARNMVL